METVLITGASSGIGAETARLLSQKQYEVILSGRDENRLQKVADGLEGPYRICAGDLRESENIEKIIECVKSGALKGKFTHLINNAGVYTPYKRSVDIPLEDYRFMFEVNFLAVVQLTMALYPFLKEAPGASVLNISSNLGIKPIPGTAHYSAQKAALNNWTQCMAQEWGADDIRVNCICPGLVKTPIHDERMFNNPKLMDELNQIQSLGRIGKPEDIAHMIGFLVSAESSWTTGSVISVDGGIL